MKCALFAQTDVGVVRQNNEDDYCLLVSESPATWKNVLFSPEMEIGTWGAFLAVADGMGGTNAGEVAAQTAIEFAKKSMAALSIAPTLPADICSFLKNIIVGAHTAIAKKSEMDVVHKGMGTTAILAWICNGRVHLAWSGDSRCYLWNPANQQFKRLSKDHSLVQDMIDKGELTDEQARHHPKSHIIMQALGDASSPPRPDVAHFSLEKGDRLLLCSDGLNTMMSDRQIRQWLASKNSIAHIGNQLVEEANNAGGFDNITIIAVELLALPEQTQKKRSALKLW